MKTYLAATTAALSASAAVLAFGAAQAQAPAGGAAANRPPPPPMKITEVKPGLYFIVGGGGNAELKVTKAGDILVDTKNMNDKDYGDLTRLIDSVSNGAKVKVVIDTHHHADHTGNNEKFIAAGAKVIGQENMPKIFEHYTTTLAPHTPASPTTLYDKTYDVKLGGAEAKLYHFGPGHTGADTVVYFPKDKAIAFGDLLVEPPTVPNYDAGNAQGSILGFQHSLAEGLKLKWDVAFPGHGDKPLTREEVVEYKRKIDQLISRIRDSIRAGVPKDKLIASIKSDDLGWKLGGQFWAPPARVDALVEELSKNPG